MKANNRTDKPLDVEKLYTWISARIMVLLVVSIANEFIS